jgi:mono/diheme cytochrome c family protein
MKPSIVLFSIAAFASLGIAARADAPDTWKPNCQSCHGATGAGSKGGKKLGVKDLTDAAYQKTFTDDQMFKDLKEGLTKDGKTLMKPFADKLSDDQIKALVAYVRTLSK